jgi:hypothetical protein
MTDDEMQTARRADYEQRRRIAEAEAEAERQNRTREIEANAAAFAARQGWDVSEPAAPRGPTPRELLLLYGSIENLSKASSDPAKRQGIRVVTYAELGEQQRREEEFTPVVAAGCRISRVRRRRASP